MIKNHPLENTFNMDSGTMDFSVFSSDNNELSNYSEQSSSMTTYQDDDEDLEIRDDIKKVFDTAMVAYANQAELSEIVEPKFAARNAEVAGTFLSTALNAIALRAKVKENKTKRPIGIPQQGTNISNSNVIVADRNSILEMIKQKKELSNT
jgi:hypothetical protein